MAGWGSLSLSLSRSLSLSLSLSLLSLLSLSHSRSLSTALGGRGGAGVADDEFGSDIIRECGKLFPRSRSRSRSLSLSRSLSGGCKLDITGAAVVSGRGAQRWEVGSPGAGAGAGMGGPDVVVEGGNGGTGVG